MFHILATLQKQLESGSLVHQDGCTFPSNDQDLQFTKSSQTHTYRNTHTHTHTQWVEPERTGVCSVSRLKIWHKVNSETSAQFRSRHTSGTTIYLLWDSGKWTQSTATYPGLTHLVRESRGVGHVQVNKSRPESPNCCSHLSE